MTTAPPSDALKNLVIFLIILTLVTTVMVLAWYFAVELPAQQAVPPSALNCYPCPCEGLTRCVGGCCRPPGA